MTNPSHNGEIAAAASDVVKIYGKGDTAVHALDGIDAEFGRGGFHAIMGPSGSGKSTLLHCFAALDNVTSGTITLGDTDLATLSEKDRTILRRTRIGFVFQAYNLVPTLTADENIKLPARLGHAELDDDWLGDLVGTLGLDDRLGHRPSELSGGQQQRVAAARAFATRPDVVFADEPTGALDSNSSDELLGFMQRVVKEQDQTVIMVTHDPKAAGFADRVTFLADGKIVDTLDDPDVESVLDRMKTLGA